MDYTNFQLGAREKALEMIKKEMPKRIVESFKEGLEEKKSELSQLKKAGIFNDRRDYLEVFIMHYEFIIDAVSKQIDKELYFEGDGYDGDGDIVYDMATCPTCGHTFFDGDEGWHCKCCIQCGQALSCEDDE